jgi:2-succinyl-5-enolpyruvyl-6-hydroxy-3-cyclohexene-1-carboxylate synthase
MAEKVLNGAMETCSLSEPWVTNAVTRLLSDGHRLVLSSSMPVRDAEMFASRVGATAEVIANRGASGIDGTVATAVGASIGSDGPVTVVIGDLALLHDLNSLALVRKTKEPFVIVAINNDGGGIFSFLPIAKYPQHFEKVFGTPHGLVFENAAKMFGIEYAQPKSTKDFETAYRDACQRMGATLIEVRTNREENLRLHRKIQEAVKKAIDQQA